MKLSRLPLPSFLNGSGKKKLTDVQANILPSVADWLKKHPEYGEPEAVELSPNWAFGKRQVVYFKGKKPALFYEKEGKITTVYTWSSKKGMQKVWGEYDQAPQNMKNLTN